MRGHSDQVTAVKFGEGISEDRWSLLSGSANGELCVWHTRLEGNEPDRWTLLPRLKPHQGSLNAIATLPSWRLFATAAADSTIKVWKFGLIGEEIIHVCTIDLNPRFIPLSIAIGNFMSPPDNSPVFITVAGTRNFIQAYTLSDVTAKTRLCTLQATLIGHEGWVTSLALKGVGERGNWSENGLWLASASQDKSVRIWRISRCERNRQTGSKDCANKFEQNLNAKVYTICAPSVTLSVTFEALLLGHEDWIYTASWSPQSATNQLLTVSADNSLIIWEPEPVSGIWLSNSRLGEISGQKGATSATGSTGGFWIGLWSPDASAVTCLGKTGSWSIWQHDRDRSFWVQRTGITGHTKAVTDLSWSHGGEYLLSSSSDQTTRLHAEWQSQQAHSWHEFSRPQIHGYDLSCVESLSTTRFVSGADEKLLRVFDQPRNVAHMLERSCGFGSSTEVKAMPEAANMPVLGLSNKAVVKDAIGEVNGDYEGDDTMTAPPTAHDPNEPPTEDYLARHTLWPEHEKLYGHGHEISALTANSSGSIIATACKASSSEHAVIRMYDTSDWHEIRPPLVAHSLTIAQLKFHVNNQQLLSVGRDRQWALFKPTEAWRITDTQNSPSQKYCLVTANSKAHSRMVLDVAWSASGKQSFFATASRDKTIKVWASRPRKDDEFTCKMTIARKAPVTAIALLHKFEEDLVCLAAGEETGAISYHLISAESLADSGSQQAEPVDSVELDERVCPSKAITRLAWRPKGWQQGEVGSPDSPNLLAVASADTSLRILSMSSNAKKTDKLEEQS